MNRIKYRVLATALSVTPFMVVSTSTMAQELPFVAGDEKSVSSIYVQMKPHWPAPFVSPVGAVGYPSNGLDYPTHKLAYSLCIKSKAGAPL